MRCPNCQTLNQEEARYCGRCGAALALPEEAPNGGWQRFCDMCGLRLPASSSEHVCPARAQVAYAFEAPLALESERKQVTVVFADISDSTKLISGLDPEAAWALLDPVLRVMTDAVTVYGGTVNQTRGDGIMALIGAPLAQEDHAVRGCLAALRMHQLIDELFGSGRSQDARPVRIHIGIATGEVLVGTFGTDLSRSYNAVGEILHVASRLQSLAQPGQTLCTGETIRQAVGVIAGRSLGVSELRGVRDGVKVVEVIGLVPTRTRFHHSIARGLTPFLGREREFERLQGCVDRTLGGAGQLVELVGDAGIGKSRLVWELARSLEARGWLVLETGGVFYAGENAYHPITRLLRQHFGIGDLDDRATAGRKIVEGLRAVAPDVDEMQNGIMFLAGLDPDAVVWREADPRQRRQAVRDAFIGYVTRLAERAPTLIVVEDLHWIDQETHALLDTLVKRSVSARVLVLVDYRSQHEPHWSHHDQRIRLDLEPLSEASIRCMIELMVPDPAATAVLGEQLVARAAGNPFFLEEIVIALAERQVLRGGLGAYRMADTTAPLQVPSSVRAILESRVDRLPAVQKRLLQAAAIIGVPCSVPLLGAVLEEIPENNLHQHLLRLSAAGLLSATGLYSESLYAFKHALIQEVAHEALPFERRRNIHAAVVRGIELVYPERRSEYVETLAYHSAQGELWDKLAVHARQAGRKVAGQSGYPAAIRYFEQALAAFERLPQTDDMIEEIIDTRFELRNALFPLGEIELDLTNLHHAETLAAKLKDGSKQAWVSSYLARDIALRGTAEEALIASRQALALAEKTGDEDLRLATHSYVGQALCALGEYRQSADVMRSLLEEIASRDLSRRYGMPLPGQVMFRCWLIWALSPLGPSTEIKQAMADLRRAAATVDQPLSLTVARYSCGFSLVNQGLVGEAVADLEEALALCRRWELSAWFRRIASCLGYAYACVSRIEEGLALLEDVIQRSRSRGVMPGHSLEVCWLAEAQLNANLMEDAEGNARSAISLARQSRERGNEARALSLLGEIELRVAPADGAVVEETIRVAFDHAVSMGMQPLIAKCQRLLLLLQQRRVASGVVADGALAGA